MTRESGTGGIARGSDCSQDRAGAPSILLLRQSPTTEGGRDACIDAMTAHPPSTANLLVITHGQSPDEWLATWRERIGEPPANLVFITTGTTRAPTRTTPPAQETAAGAPQVRSIPNPGALTQLGIAGSECLVDWQDTDRRPVVCGGSITALLQWVDLPVLFRFLHMFLQRLRSADTLGHFHLDSTAHTDQTHQTLEPLFDRLIDEPLKANLRRSLR